MKEGPMKECLRSTFSRLEWRVFRDPLVLSQCTHRNVMRWRCPLRSQSRTLRTIDPDLLSGTADTSLVIHSCVGGNSRLGWFHC
ncbi:hypothetical protein PENTCL1PPCAC_15000 [Pristionchus entomophagus]|uniref:Uncharacterized protein n=1 Tax=Pristionchus entomophagus TaxID=358040 RepID=A0AAV5TB90_9BILA|nr:hypothetical protein PENTCL1PPCAC_15000 [Pristionchus entomophagus]